MRSFVPFLLLILFASVSSANILSNEVLAKIPAGIDLADPLYESAKRELEETVSNCGPNVIRGLNSPTPGKCSFQITLNRDYFEDHANRTGLLHQRDWATKDGVTFYEASARTVPDNFDLRDLMKSGQPEIRQQQCGDCWAWSTHHALEIARAVHDQKALDLSVQSVLSCSHEGSCLGGAMSAVDFLKQGLPFEEDFPYAGYDKLCKFGSSQLKGGWNPKVHGTPYIGSSFDHSLAFKEGREGSKVRRIMEAMVEWKSPVVVTVASFNISGSGVYDSCSAINSGGNHMVAIVGWEMWNGKRVAHVWNSHGQDHGEKGVSRILWECGDGQLNRGLGYSAKIVQYKPVCVPPDAAQTYLHEVLKGNPAEIGASQTPTTACSWLPREGLDNPDSCVTLARPVETTEYHLAAKNDCGSSSSVALVHVWGQRGGRSNRVLTPFGYVKK